MFEHDTACVYISFKHKRFGKLNPLKILLNGLQHEFSLLDVTETWLKDDGWSLFDIQGYNKLENHRQSDLEG